MENMTPLTSLPEWNALVDETARIRNTTLRDMFRDDPGRSGDLSFDCGPLHVDLSKNLVDFPLLRKLTGLAQASGLEKRRAAMFAGEHINVTEDRAVLHTALRIPVDQDLSVDGQDVAADVHDVLGRMRDFAKALRSGSWRGSTNHTVKEVVNIGIGGTWAR